MVALDSGVLGEGDLAKSVDFCAKNVTLAYEEHEVIRDLSLKIRPREITSLVGPNGSGKSTLLKGLARLMKPSHGGVYLDSQAIHRLPTKKVARQLAMLPQRPESPDGLTVRELVAFGRFPHQGFFGICTEEDDDKIDEALEITGMDAISDRLLGELSGGQRQLAWLAMSLAQDTRLLLLDEPTTFLDMSHQIEVLDVLKRLNEEHGRTIVMVLHDLNLAARYSTHMAAISEGRIFREGKPWDILCAEVLDAVFHIQASILRDPVSGAPICVPYAVRN